MHRKLDEAWRAFRRLFRRRQPGMPDDPYAYVTAPKKPRPLKGGAAVAEEPER
jgi:hypothetical protein